MHTSPLYLFKYIFVLEVLQTVIAIYSKDLRERVNVSSGSLKLLSHVCQNSRCSYNVSVTSHTNVRM